MPTLETKKLYKFLKDNYIEVPKNATGFRIEGEMDSQLKITWITFAQLSVVLPEDTLINNTIAENYISEDEDATR